jgi:hypothetical protein
MKGNTNTQIRSLAAARNQRRLVKAAQVRKGPPLRSAQVEQGRTLTASLTEQSKLRELRAPDFDLVL